MELQGIAVSAGIGIGRVLAVAPAELDYSHVVPAGAKAEQERLNKAVAAFTEATRSLAQAARQKAGEQQAGILEGQLTMLSDPLLQRQLSDKLKAGESAEGAVDSVCQSFMELFASTGDELMAQRAADVSDLRTRLLSLLLGQEQPDLSALPEETVLVVHDLTPSMTTTLNAGHVAAIVSETGGFTSHSAILARAMELPAVLSVPNALNAIPTGATAVVDGGSGIILIEPEAELLHTYKEKQAALLADKAALSAFRGKPTRTASGGEIRLLGNIGSPQDAQAVARATGEGIGLFRTEFLFMNRPTLPTEEEQFSVYRQAAEQFPQGEVIIRTLDVGGDKAVPCLELPREENPFLGFRAIRYCLAHQEIFSTQLRALLRASAFGPIKVMLPLVTRLSEMRQARTLLEEQKAALDREGTPYNRELPLGIMVETPAAVLMADLFAQEADFFSIGTNDLTQYTMVADRGNLQVAHLGSPFDPAVLRAIRQTVVAGHVAGIPVGMCGEAAADPRLIPLLLAFELDEFSVSASSVLSTRREISQWSLTKACQIASEAMALETEAQVKAYLEQQLSP